MRALALLLLTGPAYADATAPTQSLVPLACEATLTDVGRAMGLGRREIHSYDDRWSIDWGVGPIDCDGDSYTVSIAKKPPRMSAWTTATSADAMATFRRARGRSLSVDVSMAVYHDRERAQKFLRLARAALDQCIAQR
jgi:hypothetical protein